MKNQVFFHNKVVIITGASSGIGKALALQLARLGAKVVLAARNEPALNAVAQQILDSGGEALFVRTDVAVERDVARLVNLALDWAGRVDIYISNAGQYLQGRIEDSCAGDFQRSLEVNFMGALYGVKAVLPIMTRQKSGHIVLVNSLDAKKGVIGDAPYVAAKSALDGFGDVLRQEVQSQGIKVLSVYPARVDTPMIDHLEVPGLTPKMPPVKVAEAVIAGIMKNKVTVYVPGNAVLLGVLNDLFPRTADRAYKGLRVEGVKVR